MISQLSVSFVDPDTFEEHGVSGPFRVVTSGEGEVTLIGHDSRTLRETPLRIRTQRDAVWALLDRGDRTFAVRLY